MDKNESLAILDSVCKQMESMSEEQLFDYMMSNSETFRKHIEQLKNTVELSLDLDDRKKLLLSEAKAKDFTSEYVESKMEHINIQGDDSWLQAA